MPQKKTTQVGVKLKQRLKGSMKYEILILDRAFADIQEAINYYESKQEGLSFKFEKALDKNFETLELNPKFKIEYKNIHVIPLKKFPYLIHFRVDDIKKVVTIEAVFNTSKDPKGKPYK